MEFPVPVSLQTGALLRLPPATSHDLCLVWAPQESGLLAWYICGPVGWGIALFEYLLQVPANHIGASPSSAWGQLKILQRSSTLGVFVPFAVFYMGQP